MARSFSEREKEHIRNHLMELCRQSWARYGYKKTSVDELCKKAGISKGAFIFFMNRRKLCSVRSFVRCRGGSAIRRRG